MTLKEAKDKTYMLLDEHSSGGEIEHDEDIEAKMTAFFDIAQKNLSRIRRIRKTFAVRRVSGRTAYAMPADFSDLCRVWRDGRPATNAYLFRAGKLLVPERDRSADIVVEYFAVPGTIGADTPDDYEFEIDEAACECMPYFVAAQQLLPDLVMDYGAMLAMYDRAAAALGGNGTEPGRVGQRLFGGGRV